MSWVSSTVPNHTYAMHMKRTTKLRDIAVMNYESKQKGVFNGNQETVWICHWI